MKLFGTSGVRRPVSSITPEFAAQLGSSLASYTADETVCIGVDPRTSREMLKSAFISGILSCGKNAADLGVVPTPTVGVAASHFGTGVMITASHNPPEYNGFKFWSRKGAYSPQMENKIEKIFGKGEYRRASWEKIGCLRIEREAYLEEHKKKILDRAGKLSKRIKIVIDCANGAGSVLTPYLLRDMGADVIAVNCQTDGFFPAHPLEPTEENLAETAKIVKSVRADVGIVHDGDADRTAVIGNDGAPVGWDALLSILAYGKKKVVSTVDASMCVEEVCVKLIRTKVGDVPVAEAVRLHDADFGGEPSGSFIFPSVHNFPDGPLGAALIAKMVAEGEFYDILNGIKKYPNRRLKIPCKEEKKKRVMDELKSTIDRDFTDIDGIRIEYDGGWVLIRPSGTEPYLRITAEAKTEKTLGRIVRCAQEMIARTLDR